MGRADGYQFEYLDDNRRFADQVNGALFQGRQLVKPDELEAADMQIVYHGEEGKPKELKSVVDKIRMWRGGIAPYPGDRESDLCGLPYGTAEYADGMFKLS